MSKIPFFDRFGLKKIQIQIFDQNIWKNAHFATF